MITTTNTTINTAENEAKAAETRKAAAIKLPCKKMCGHNCADGCIYWQPYDRDHNGRQYCSHYGSYYYPRERQGCLSYR